MKISVLDFLISLLAFPGIVFALSLSVVLFIKREGRKTAHILLALLLLVASLALINNLIYLIGLPAQFNELYFLPLDFTLSLGPLLYFYFKFKLNPSSRFRASDGFHFIIPSVQALVYLWVGFSSLSFKYHVWQSGFMEKIFMIDNILFPLLLGCYIFLAFALLKGKKAKTHYWDSQLFKWLNRFLTILVIIMVFRVFFTVLELIVDGRPGALDYVHFLALLVMMIWLSVKAWEQYFPEFIYQFGGHGEPKHEKKLVSKDFLDFRQKTTELFENDMIFKNPDLNLAMLSQAYGLSDRKVSEMLRKVFDRAPNDFINSYRLAYVLKALDDGKHESFTLLSIAFEAGFPSKSTFYRIFKEKMQFTPSEYITRLC